MQIAEIVCVRIHCHLRRRRRHLHSQIIVLIHRIVAIRRTRRHLHRRARRHL